MHMNLYNSFYLVKNIQLNYKKNAALPHLLINFKQVSWKYTCTCAIPGIFWRAVRIVLLTIKYMCLTYIVPSLTSLATRPDHGWYYTCLLHVLVYACHRKVGVGCKTFILHMDLWTRPSFVPPFKKKMFVREFSHDLLL